VGIGTPILQSKFNHLGPLATNCWLKNLWNFVCSADIRLIANVSEVFPLQRLGNACIMDKIATLNLTPTNQAAFNHCCIAHHVYFLLDMDGWGHLLRESLLSPPTSPAHSSWSWPHASSAKTDWLVWKHFLPQLATAMALTEWVTPPHLQNFIPFDPATSMAYILCPGQFWQTY